MKLIDLSSTSALRRQLELLVPEALTGLNQHLYWRPDIFIESTISHGVVISEVDWNSIVGAGQAAIRQKFSTGPANDLGIILQLLNPTIPQPKLLGTINHLIDTASAYHGPILSHERWWRTLFKLFRADGNLMNEVNTIVSKELENTIPKPPNQVKKAPKQRENPEITRMNELSKSLQNLSRNLDQNKAAKLRLKKMFESISYDCILANEQFQNRVKPIMEDTLRSIGVTPPLLSEQGWLNRLGNMAKSGVGAIKTHLNTPQYGSHQMQLIKQKHTNKWLAKLAIQILTDKQREQLQANLTKSQLDLQSASQLLNKTIAIAQQHRNGTIPPSQKQSTMAIAAAAKRMLTPIHGTETMGILQSLFKVNANPTKPTTT